MDLTVSRVQELVNSKQAKKLVKRSNKTLNVEKHPKLGSHYSKRKDFFENRIDEESYNCSSEPSVSSS